MMASICQRQCILSAFFILAFWASQAMSRKLQEESLSERHEQWIAKYGCVYEDAVEKERRFKIFKDNVEYIESFNGAGNQPYKLSVNEFADQTSEEFKASRNGFRLPKMPRSMEKTPFRYENVTDVPTSMDWRKKGAVTPIKDQGRCGSCWAFSAVGAMEGITQLSTGKLISLSEQELVDCDIKGEDAGCGGGYMEDAFAFVKQNQGLATEANYPYKGIDGTCNTNKAASPAAKITGYEIVPINSEKALLKAVANQPVSVSIDSSGSGFQFYSSGVFTGKCGTELTHGVTGIGYGISDDGIKYWLLKNSWGTDWGEEGYMRIQRDIAAKEGLCGIAMDSSYPTV